MKFFFLLVCVAASEGVGKECCLCVCSSASKIPSQLRHRREVFSISLWSMLSLLSDSLSGRLYRDFSGDVVLDVLLLLGSWSQLCEIAGEALSREERRLLRGLQEKDYGNLKSNPFWWGS